MVDWRHRGRHLGAMNMFVTDVVQKERKRGRKSVIEFVGRW